MTDARILLVEDDEGLTAALEMFLTAKGYNVVTANDGSAALERLGEQPFDLIITDMMMPGMSGCELLARLKDSPPEPSPAVIVMTGKGTVEIALDIMKSGVSAFLRKPLNMDELEVAVSTAIDRNRLDRKLKGYYQELDAKVAARTRELTLLNSFTSLVNSSFDIELILRDAVEYLNECLLADSAWIYMVDEGTDTLRLRACKNFDPAFEGMVKTLDMKKGFSGRTFRDGGAFIFNDLSKVNVPIASAVASHGYTSAMHAAIKSGERVHGSMGVASKSGYEFKDADLQLLTSFGNQIGVAIEKIRLFEREKAAALGFKKKADELVILNEMGNMLRVSIDLELAARAVVSTVSQGLGLDRVCLWLLGEDRNTLTLRACKGVDEHMAGTTVRMDNRTLSGRAPDRDSAVVVHDPICGRLELDIKGPAQVSGSVAAIPLLTRIPGSQGINCWEHFGCREDSCPAFANPLACWMVDESCVRKFKESAGLVDKMKVCGGCEVYRTSMKGECIGMLCVERSEGALSPDDIKTLGVYANTAAAALENIRLLDRMVTSERFIDSIMANMASGLLVTDLSGRVRMINNVGAQILRLEPTTLTGASIVDMLPETARLVSVEDGNLGQVGHEVVIRTGDGPVPVGFSNSYLREHGGEPDGVIVVFRDLSEIRRLQERVREADRFAAIGKVAAGVAHEIRNPLFGITSVAQILGREIPQDSPHKVLIDAMLSETSRLNTLVEELLLYGRSTKISAVPTDLKELLEGVIEFHSPAIRGKGVAVVREFGESTPLVMVDQHQMRQIFLNLLWNALDAMPQGGEVRVGATAAGGGTVISVADNGSGIPKDELPKVFDLFFTTKDKGTGLGLAICRKIIEDHGGNVSIRSRKGEGTTVELFLPHGNL